MAAPDWTKFEEKELDGRKLQFSAGLVFASAKTPIRAQKKLAQELCRFAKEACGAGGGIDIEVLESIEPPNGGIESHRDRLLGTEWRRGDEGLSRLAVPWSEFEERLGHLRRLWIDEELPASQAHRALRKARDKGDVAGADPAAACVADLKAYVEAAGGASARTGKTA